MGYIRGVGFIIGCIFWFTSRWAYNRGLRGGGGGVLISGSLRCYYAVHLLYVRFSGFIFFIKIEFPVIIFT